MSSQKTIVGRIDSEVLAFTAREDTQLDMKLLEADCIGTAAHVTMLARLPVRPVLFSARQRDAVISALKDIIQLGRAGRFRISARDQDVHLAVERALTRSLGDIGKRVHTARSRNDQVAVDMRLYAKEEMLGLLLEAAGLAGTLLSFARRHMTWPMVGRTHLQPAMPSCVGLWASAHAESLLDDTLILHNAYELNDHCPLGSAAGYGVPLEIDRKLTARLLGFRSPVHNVLYAANARGKCEGIILSAVSQVMLSLSRLAADLILYSAPEFAYFALPAGMCTGSSIMPQKKNPDVLELVRARAARVLAATSAVTGILSGLASGYNRDLQETKRPFIDGLDTTRSCLRIMDVLMKGVVANRKALRAGFTPEIFAAERALELAACGKPFRDAYNLVLAELNADRAAGVSGTVSRRMSGSVAHGADLDLPTGRARDVKKVATRSRNRYHAAVSRLLDANYPELS